MHLLPCSGVSDLRIENHLSATKISFRQVNGAVVHKLFPQQAVHYIRDDPTGEAAVAWTVLGDESRKELTHAFLDFGMSTHVLGPVVIYALAFPDGQQRVLLLTDDLDIAHEVSRSAGLGHVGIRQRAGVANSDVNAVLTPVADILAGANLRFAVGLPGLGVSLVDDTPAEIAYLSIRGRDTWQWQTTVPDENGELWQPFFAEAEDKIRMAIAR